MTRDEITQLARTWQDRLGLSHWDIDLRIVDAQPGNDDVDEHTWMRTNRHAAYERAVIAVASHLLEDGPEHPDGWYDVDTTDHRIEVTLVHELLHCWAGPLADVADDLERWVGEPTAEQIQARVVQAEEHLVDTLARALVRSFDRADPEVDMIRDQLSRMRP